MVLGRSQGIISIVGDPADGASIISRLLLMCCHVVVGSPGQPAGKPRVAGPTAKRRGVVRSTGRPERSRCAALAAPDLLQIGFLKESLSFDAVRTSPARSARPSAPRSRRPTAEEAAEPCGDAVPTRGGVDATRGRRGRRRAQVIEATRGGPGDAVEGGAVLREERERRE